MAMADWRVQEMGVGKSLQVARDASVVHVQGIPSEPAGGTRCQCARGGPTIAPPSVTTAWTATHCKSLQVARDAKRGAD